jgi:hypothetical protein
VGRCLVAESDDSGHIGRRVADPNRSDHERGGAARNVVLFSRCEVAPRSLSIVGQNCHDECRHC